MAFMHHLATMATWRFTLFGARAVGQSTTGSFSTLAGPFEKN